MDVSKDNKAFVIGVIVVLGGFLSFYFFPDKDSAIVPLMAYVLGYYFGSSPGSHGKDQTISDLAKTALQGSNPNGKNGTTVSSVDTTVAEEKK